MYDIMLDWGTDLSADSSGDLALTTGSDQTTQRVIRRLLTNPGDYIWNLQYGGGLAAFVGQPTAAAQIEAVIRDQMALETAVAAAPAPTVAVAMINTASGSVVADITYADASSNGVVNLHIVAN
jgi:phage baseplate assembly protein W